MDSDLLRVILGLLTYLYLSACLYIIASKTGQDNAWFAFVPILDLILMLSIADKPVWWILLLLVPFLNILIMALVCMGISEARGKSSWLGILALIPVVNLAFFGYLAFSS
jgi:hypothetical protein